MKSKIDTSGWKEFKLGELFEFSAIKQAKSQQLIPTVSKEDDNSIPYVVQSKYNNMVSRYVDKQWLIDHDEPPVKGNTLVLGVTLNACSYQATSFGASQVITARLNKINKNIGIFIATIISKYIEVFTYKEKPGIKKYEQTIIKLPATDEGLPDFDYMDAYMSRIFEEEEAFVDKLEEKDFSGNKIDTSGWKKFKLGDLFDKLDLKFLPDRKFNKALDISDVKTEEYDLPLVNARHSNNGIMYYGRSSEWDYSDMTIDIVADGAASTGDVYAQPQETGVLYNAYLIKPKKIDVSEGSLFFLATVIQLCVKDHFGYDNKCTWERLQQELVKLPATAEGLPDFDYMDAYMQRIFEEEEAVADKITEE